MQHFYILKQYNLDVIQLLFCIVKGTVSVISNDPHTKYNNIIITIPDLERYP